MAQIRSRKSNFYSQKQSVREELSAPQYLQSAGDELIKRLAKKQTNTSTSLQEQLEIVQNFEKGFELNPDNRKGVASLEDFKKHVSDEKETCVSSAEREQTRDVNELMKITGLTRHELELSLCEKPTSAVSQLYMFAMQNERRKEKSEEPGKMLHGHPINHLKEIEEEYFGEVKNSKCDEDDKARGKTRKKKKHRKRKKATDPTKGSPKKICEVLQKSVEQKEHVEERAKPSSCRPSLWDVKDMKKWSESKEIGCSPQTFYTIKNGRIIKLEKDSVRKEEEEEEEGT